MPRQTTVHDTCTKCNRTLLLLLEAEQGECAACLFDGLSQEWKQVVLNLQMLLFHRDPTKEQVKAGLVSEIVRYLREKGRIDPPVWKGDD